jgi:hypothetical protein
MAVSQGGFHLSAFGQESGQLCYPFFGPSIQEKFINESSSRNSSLVFLHYTTFTGMLMQRQETLAFVDSQI